MRLVQLATGGFGEAEFPGVGFGLGFGVGRGPGATASAGSAGEFYWGGAASTAFWVDPVEDLTVVFMTQLLPSAAYPFRAQLAPWSTRPWPTDLCPAPTGPG